MSLGKRVEALERSSGYSERMVWHVVFEGAEGHKPVGVRDSGKRWDLRDGETMQELWARAEAEAEPSSFGVVVLIECYDDDAKVNCQFA